MVVSGESSLPDHLQKWTSEILNHNIEEDGGAPAGI